MVSAFDNTVCIFIKADLIEIPISTENAQALIEELQKSIINLKERQTLLDKEGMNYE